MDGKGYPDRLDSAAIPLVVRVLSVADVYDALSSERPYRSLMAHSSCRDVMMENAASGGLDLELARIFFETVTQPIASTAGGQEPRVESSQSATVARP